MGGVSWRGGSREVAKPTTIAWLKMKDVCIYYRWHSHYKSPFNCNIYTWAFPNQTMCDRYFYPTTKMCNIVTLWPTIKLQQPIPIYHPIKKKIRILEVSLGTSFFTSTFIKDAMLKDVQHLNLLFRMNDVHVAFGIITYYFMQHPLYLLQCTLPFSTFIKSPIFLFFSSFKCLDTFWVQNPLIAQKDF
jgi:hypothetical protein